VGTHIATVTVSGIGGTGAANIQSRSFSVSFEVTAMASYLMLANNSAPISLGLSDLSALCSDSAADTSITVGGQTVVKSTITKVVIVGSEFAGLTALPDSFCRNFSSLTQLDLSGLTELTSIGAYFLAYCGAFNQPLTFPSTLTSVGAYFLRNCTAFNQPLTFLPTLTSLDTTRFLWYCESFNQPITLPPTLTSINEMFMVGCKAFNRDMVVPVGVTSISDHFLRLCDSLNSQITLPLTLTSIGWGFLSSCTAYNKPITIPSSVTYIGTEFITDCRNMISPITINCPATALKESSWTFASEVTNAKCFTVGMTIAGPNKAAVMARFPNHTAGHYRKLIAAP
jgi:hypothetical protein